MFSHATALSLHELSDVMPAKLHMTVPPGFRRMAAIPEVLRLHRARLSGRDVQTIDGVRLTTPTRTLLDVIAEGAIAQELLVQAVDEALRRGVVTRRQLEEARVSTRARQRLDRVLKQVPDGSSTSVRKRGLVSSRARGAPQRAKASEQDAEKIRQDKFKFPGTGTMVTQADEAFQTGGFFAAAKTGNWNTLNSFTHTGGMQLGRRFTQNDLAINYPDEELAHAVKSTLTAVGILALPFLASIKRADDVAKVTAILERIAKLP